MYLHNHRSDCPLPLTHNLIRGMTTSSFLIPHSQIPPILKACIRPVHPVVEDLRESQNSAYQIPFITLHYNFLLIEISEKLYLGDAVSSALYTV